MEDLRGTTAVLAWDSNDRGSNEQVGTVSYTIECCRLSGGNSSGGNSWAVVNRNVVDGVCVVQDLEPGETYSFRVIAHRSSTFDASSEPEQSEPSLPSKPLTVPGASAVKKRTTDDANNPLRLKRDSLQELDSCWQRDFERQYIELEELGRGRFSVVRRCQQILTGAEVAVKFVNRKRRQREDTRKEYELILRADGGGGTLVETGGLFATSSSDAIVLSL